MDFKNTTHRTTPILLSKQEYLFFGYKPTLNILILSSDQPIRVLESSKTQNPKYNSKKNSVQKFQYNNPLNEYNKYNRNIILKKKKLLLNTLNGFAYLIAVEEWLVSWLNIFFLTFRDFFELSRMWALNAWKLMIFHFKRAFIIIICTWKYLSIG